MEKQKIIGVDLGGTKVQSARILDTEIEATKKVAVTSNGKEQKVIDEVIQAIEAVFEEGVRGIGIGVPSIVNVEKGIVYDVQNIPSWKEVPLKQILESHFQVPVFVNNDANCFALGEFYFGKGKAFKNLIGLIVGTGLAAGIIIENRLYNGHNCGAGEFGMLPYLQHHYEYYCSGQYFSRVTNKSGEEWYNLAKNNNQQALSVFAEFGHHLGNAIIAILYTLDPEIIILGGSVSKAYPFYRDALWKSLETFAYSPVVKRLSIEQSSHPNIALLGAAALCLNANS